MFIFAKGKKDDRCSTREEEKKSITRRSVKDDKDGAVSSLKGR